MEQAIGGHAAGKCLPSWELFSVISGTNLSLGGRGMVSIQGCHTQTVVYTHRDTGFNLLPPTQNQPFSPTNQPFSPTNRCLFLILTYISTYTIEVGAVGYDLVLMDCKYIRAQIYNRYRGWKHTIIYLYCFLKHVGL